MSLIPKNSFACTENTENGGTHLWITNEDSEPMIHILGPLDNGFRTELIVNLNADQLEEFKRQVASL